MPLHKLQNICRKLFYPHRRTNSIVVVKEGKHEAVEAIALDDSKSVDKPESVVEANYTVRYQSSNRKSQFPSQRNPAFIPVAIRIEEIAKGCG
ncbi:unnamed protein product [Cuscuta campestris]|uniref:Uncharacterized protein n=1 Tax=Cuscuta campestris TaxID=132261 RepID=A0A484N7U3_9ASTE|nr:unnamed protein product [Cuscuta campestris]